MIQYILECIAFQLVFLIIYDLFLKRETFFQWNRAYLIGTYLLSMILPCVKIEALKTSVPEVFQGYPDFLWHVNDAAMTVVASEKSNFNMSWEYIILLGGMFVATVFFAYKLLQIHRLRQAGEVRYFKDFTRIVISNSALAFSFFKSIFLGDKVLENEHQSIVQHELVHIRQKHSYDLMFFELMRIVAWFNPLVYVYQKRVSELHEYIADAKVAKTHQKEQYQFLLSQVFQTQNISFINQFFKSSLIKKRIVMLQKSNSGKIWRLKYLLLVPIVLGMLFYTSLEGQEIGSLTSQKFSDDQKLIEQIEQEIKENLAKSESATALSKLYPQFYQYDSKNPILSKEDFFRQQILNKTIFENTKPVEFGDDVKPRKLRAPITLPSTSGYRNYINREKTFQILDKNLMLSIDQQKVAIRIIQKEDKNLGPGEFVTVDNVSDLTGNEIRKINNIIDKLDFRNKILFFSDDTYAFVVSKLADSKEEIDKKKDAEKQYEQLLKERVRLLQNMDENNPVIVEFDKQLAGLREAIFGDRQTVPFAKVDEVPIFPWCENDDDTRACFQQKMQRHIAKNFNYPEAALEKGLQGKVATLFTINEVGLVQNIKLRGPDIILENEAERIISRLPKMLPGKHKGKVVGVTYSIPITFKLQADKKEKPKEVDTASDIPFAIVEEVPVFPGCENDKNKRACFNAMIQKHISKNFNYPKEAQEKGIQGRVNIMFTIAKEGGIKNLRMRGPDQLLEEEARRIIMRLPDMRPGRHKGKNVDVPFSIPISFRLEDDVIDLDSIKLGLSFSIDPIYFVDGQESSKEKVSTINPNDIESMSVLKGESALMIYGEKGKNGVIQIITKKKE